MRSLLLAFSSALLFCAISTAILAETITMKDGRVLQGAVRDQNMTTITLETPQGVIQLNKGDIRRIQYGNDAKTLEDARRAEEKRRADELNKMIEDKQTADKAAAEQKALEDKKAEDAKKLDDEKKLTEDKKTREEKKQQEATLAQERMKKEEADRAARISPLKAMGASALIPGSGLVQQDKTFAAYTYRALLLGAALRAYYLHRQTQAALHQYTDQRLIYSAFYGYGAGGIANIVICGNVPVLNCPAAFAPGFGTFTAFITARPSYLSDLPAHFPLIASPAAARYLLHRAEYFQTGQILLGIYLMQIFHSGIAAESRSKKISPLSAVGSSALIPGRGLADQGLVGSAWSYRILMIANALGYFIYKHDYQHFYKRNVEQNKSLGIGIVAGFAPYCSTFIAPFNSQCSGLSGTIAYSFYTSKPSDLNFSNPFADPLVARTRKDKQIYEQSGRLLVGLYLAQIIHAGVAAALPATARTDGSIDLQCCFAQVSDYNPRIEKKYGLGYSMHYD